MKKEQTLKKRKRGTVHKLFSFSWRFLTYGFLLISLLLSLGFAFLVSDWFESILADQVISGLKNVVDSPVDMSGLMFDLLGRRVVINGLTIGSADSEQFPDPLQIDEIILEVGLTDILRGKLNLKNVSIYRPALRITQTSDGETNIPAFISMEEPKQSMELEVHQVDVFSGILDVNGQQLNWDISSGAIRFKAENFGNDVFRGFCRIDNLLIQPPLMKVVQVDVGVNFRNAADMLNLRAVISDETGHDLSFNRCSYDWQKRALELAFDLTLDSEILEIADTTELAGEINFSGDLLWSEGGDFRLGATVLSDRIQIGTIVATNIYDSIEIDSNRFLNSDIRMNVMGGQIQGSAEITNYTETPYLAAQLAVQNINLKNLLDSAGIDYIKVDSVLSSQLTATMYLDDPETLSIAGRLDGTMKKGQVVKWNQGVEILRAERDEALLDSAILPLGLFVDFEYAQNSLKVKQGSWAKIPASRIELLGEFSAETFRARMNSRKVNTIESALALANVDRLFAAAFPDAVQLYGLASFVRLFDADGQFSFDLRGPVDRLSYDLKIQTDNVRYMGHEVGPGEGTISFSSTTVNLERLHFSLGQGQLDLGGTIELPPPTAPYGTPSQIELLVNAENIELSKIGWLLDPTEQTQFAGTGSAELEIKFSDPLAISGKGNISLMNPAFGDTSVKKADFELTFGETLGFNKLEILGLEDEIISGSATYVPQTEQWATKLIVRSLDLQRYSRLFGDDVDVTGMVQVDLDVKGKRLEAEGTADFSIQSLTVQGNEFGTISGHLDAKGVEGKLILKTKDDEFVFNSKLDEDSIDTIQFNLENEFVDFTDLIQKFYPDEQIYLSVYDGATFTINVNDKGFDSIEILLGTVAFGFDQFSLTSDKARFTFDSENKLVFDKVTFKQGGQEGRSAILDGHVILAEKGPILLNLRGSINLFTLNELIEEITLSGEGDAELRVRGTIDDPHLFGRLSVVNGFLRHLESDLTFSDVNGEIRLSGDTVEIVTVAARFSQGSVVVDGVIEMNWALLQPRQFQLTTQGADLQFDVLEGLSASLNSTLAVSGSFDDMLISGDIDLTRANYTRRFDPEAEVARFSSQQPLAIADESLRNIKLDIGIKGVDNISVDNNFAKMNVALDLRVLGNILEPGVLGRVEVTKGDVYYRDRKYEIDTGVIDFLNPNKIDPQFDFLAETQVKEFRVFLELHGSLERLYPELRSDPALDSVNIFNLLATGKVRDNPFPSDMERLQEQLLRLGLSGFLTKQITGELERRTEDILGIDRFRIDPFILEESANPVARVTVGEQITDNFSVVYSTNLSREDLQVLTFEYRLSPSLLLIGTRERRDNRESESESSFSFALDIHLQHKFK